MATKTKSKINVKPLHDKILVERDEAESLEAFIEERVVGRGVTGLFDPHAARVVRLTRDRAAEVLDEEGNAAERTVGEVPGRLDPGRLEAGVDHGVDVGIDGLDSLDCVVDQFRW